MKIAKSTEITVRVDLDDKDVPVNMYWKASDDPNGEALKSCKGLFLSLFEEQELGTVGIDLWTTKMEIIEMDRFMFQTMRRLAETYRRATNNTQLADDFQRFVQYFGERTEILEKS